MSDSSAFYRIQVTVCGDDRLSCSAHLRKIADMVMSGDAPGWTTSDVNGSAWADRLPQVMPNVRVSPLDAVVSQHIRGRLPGELALGFARYEALRRLNPRQYRELHDRNMFGENFDRMVDALVLANSD